MKKAIFKKLWLILALSCGFSTVGCGMTSNGGNGGNQESSASKGENSESGSDFEGTSSSNSGEETPSGHSNELSIHFMYLGNQTSGDGTLIKIGDTEVLIDAGSTRGSADTLVDYIDDYCTDGVLEYVVVTHADQDHIAAFVGDEYMHDGIFELFDCETIIDFPKTTKSTDIYKEYVELRNKQVQSGAVHYTALECYNNANGAQRTYTLGANVTMQFLYQKFYEESTSVENNNSVCLLITQGENNYLFTGDLEASGEKSLVECNELPKCQLYKAGHHGSKTSSTTDLISVIQPKMVVANCCCGDKHGFPHQEFINNIAPYTTKLYIPSAVSDSGHALLNGNIVITSTGGELTVNCSNNNTLFKNTDWFAAHRVMPDAWKISG